MNYIIKLLLTAATVWVGANYLPDVSVNNYTTALFVALALSLLNTFLKPILKLLSLPITLMSLGLFLLVINVGIIYLAAYFVEGFNVSGFMSPLIFSFGLSVVTCILGAILD